MKIGNSPPPCPTLPPAREDPIEAPPPTGQESHAATERPASATAIAPVIHDIAPSEDWTSISEGINTISRILCRPALGGRIFQEACQELGVTPQDWSPEQLRQIDLSFDLQMQRHMQSQPTGTAYLDLAAAKRILMDTMAAAIPK